MAKRVYRTICPRDCYDTCILLVEVSEGVVTSIRGDPLHPVTRGATCPRAVGDPLRLTRGRILYPYLRVGGKPDGRLVRITWDQALDIAASRLSEVLREHGPEAVLHISYAGNMGLITWYYTRRLWNALGATSTDYSLCSSTGHEAIGLHYGLSYGVLPEEIEDMEMIVFWGINAAVSAIHLWLLALNARRRRGSLLATIDPRVTETARASDIHLRPRPGTDVALAYGVARHLIANNLVDREFIERYTYGFEKFAEEAAKWSLERVERVTGVSKKLIEAFAEEYAKRKPSVVFIGMGLTRTPNGPDIARVVSLLPALVGQHRGFYYTNSRGWLLDLALITGETYGAKPSRVVSMAELGELLDKGEFHYVYIYGINAVESLPASHLVARGLARRDVFVVVHDTHWNTTTRYADLVLPAPTYLEKTDLPLTYGHATIVLGKKVVEPLGESRPEYEVVWELAKRLGIEEDWLYDDPLKVLARAVEDALQEGTIKDLLEGRLVRLRQRPRNEYQTPTGRIEFYSTRAEKLGLNPLPQHRDIVLGPDDYILLTGAHPRYTNSQFREVYGLHPPVVYVNPVDAKRSGIMDGGKVLVYNSYGEVCLRAVVTSSVPEKTLWTTRHVIGLNGKPINTLMPPVRHRVGGTPVLNAVKVKIKPID